MRIWSLHPKYLDSKGLVALWRETLLAKNVLIGNTRGYKNHPQLHRFKKTNYPVQYIDKYLTYVYYEAVTRGYNFNRQKINWPPEKSKLKVTKGQVEYEFKHLLNKLKERQKNKYNELQDIDEPELHPLFMMISGDVEEWEVKKVQHITKPINTLTSH